LRLGDPEAARLLLKTLELIGKRLDSQQSVLDVEVLRLSEFQQGVLLRAMDSALGFAKAQLAERYPQILSSELDELVAEGLFRAKGELSVD
jgi:hypothetical protein